MQPRGAHSSKGSGPRDHWLRSRSVPSAAPAEARVEGLDGSGHLSRRSDCSEPVSGWSKSAVGSRRTTPWDRGGGGPCHGPCRTWPTGCRRASRALVASHSPSEMAGGSGSWSVALKADRRLGRHWNHPPAATDGPPPLRLRIARCQARDLDSPKDLAREVPMALTDKAEQAALVFGS